MLHLIEDGKIGVIITKDLSGLGRNYIEVGSYTEIYFPKNNVRYIAVNEFFCSLLHLIEDGKIGVIITKDLSGLGRNYIEVGSYTEIYFPKNNVRYIAVNEFFCSLLGAFKNFIHRSGYIAVLPVVKCCCYSDFHSVTTFLNRSKSTGLNAIKKHSDFVVTPKS